MFAAYRFNMVPVILLRLFSLLFGLIAIVCSYGWMMLFTLIAAPLGIICWLAAWQLEKKLAARSSVPAIVHACGWIAIITNGLGLLVSLLLIIVLSID
jgi:hypothetical protein